MASEDNKRIAKNTLFLYLRLGISILVNFYTVRLLWRVLGIDNYGIYNLVGGIVMMFAFINNAMIASSQRYIAFALGKNDFSQLQKTFSISLTVHVLIAIIVLVFAETIGLWFLNNKLNIPNGRMVAANWVYQCSILSFMFTIVSVPYNACIVAHEHMNVYGYFGIIDVFLKLGIVLLVAILPFDALISYAVLILCLSCVMRIVYSMYCQRHFEECHFIRFKDSHLIKDMFSFAGWSFLGNMGITVRDQGINIILNMFFNVAVNAAKGIGNQIGSVINGFSSNFTMAINPQLTKRYAIGDIKGMLQLLFNGCKYSLLLMSLIVIPLIFSAPTILRLWLGDVATYTVGFLQLILLMALVDSVINPITTSLQATGKIKKFQIIISIITIANLPLSWLCLKIYAIPYVVMIVALFTSIVALITRLILLHEQIRFSYKQFIFNVYGKTLPFLLIMFFLSWKIYTWFKPEFLGMLGYFVSVWSIFLIFASIMVLNKSERHTLIQLIQKRFRKCPSQNI